MIDQVLVPFRKSGRGFVQAVVTLVATTRSLVHDLTLLEKTVQEIMLVMELTHHQQQVEER
jgi:hypothetical protein